jgi:hypothetical protein
MDKGIYHLHETYLESVSYLLPLVSKTSFTEWYSVPSHAPTLICLPCCVILACSKVWTWDSKFVIQMNPWITHSLLFVISSHKSRVGAREAKSQWTRPEFTSIVCGEPSTQKRCLRVLKYLDVATAEVRTASREKMQVGMADKYRMEIEIRPSTRLSCAIQFIPTVSSVCFLNGAQFLTAWMHSSGQNLGLWIWHLPCRRFCDDL